MDKSKEISILKEEAERDFNNRLKQLITDIREIMGIKPYIEIRNEVIRETVQYTDLNEHTITYQRPIEVKEIYYPVP